jgi:hypothetical protein
VDRRQSGPHAATLLQHRLELGQRKIGCHLDQLTQFAFVALELRPPVPAEAVRGRAAGRAHPPHQLDRG